MFSKIKPAKKLLKDFVNYWTNNDYKENYFCKSSSFISYDKSTKLFSIKNNDLNLDELVNIRRKLIIGLREIIPKNHIKIDEIITGYYDQCLERYIYERLNRNYKNEDTCWLKYAQNNKCRGWQKPDGPFDEKSKTEFYKKFCKLNPTKTIEKSFINNLYRNEQGYVFGLSDRFISKDDKVLSLYNKIRKSGFSNFISAFRSSPIILDFSLVRNKYNVMSGRHRIAVLRYLRSQGKIRNIKVKCHILEHPYESLIYTRPYKDSCKKCNWGDIYDPGEGTHQNFTFREGVANLRGHPKRKGGTQKWNLIRPIFKQMVENKSILDVGSHRGLYCIKALEYGAKTATALDTGAHHITNLNRVKEKYCLDDLLVYKGDFFNKNDFKKFYKNKFDTIFLFGIIHHLLRIGIQKNLLTSYDELMERISDISNHGVIIEFAMPREKDFFLPELKKYKNIFNIDKFENSLNKFFPNHTNLGKCKYTSGNRFGRFMFFATKD